MNWIIAVVMSLAVGFAMADKSVSSAGVVGKARTAVVKKLALIVYWMVASIGFLLWALFLAGPRHRVALGRSNLLLALSDYFDPGGSLDAAGLEVGTVGMKTWQKIGEFVTTREQGRFPMNRKQSLLTLSATVISAFCE